MPRPPRDQSSSAGCSALLAIVGPTGTGKTALAVRLAEACRGEVVGCDALQVYRGLDAATAKPSAEERARVRHHLVDIQDPRQDFTLARFVTLAERTLEEILQRGCQPILVGGTGLYLRGLLRGIVPAPAVDPEIRRRLKRVQARRGQIAVHRWLARVDPSSAARIEPADRQRVGRALEWWLASGTRWSERLERQGTWATARERHRCLKIGLDAGREWLRPRLEARVDAFFAAGLVDEVRGLLDAGVSPGSNAFKAIGYREVVAALNSAQAVDEIVEHVKLATRRYAKRQRTWFRKEPNVVWLEASANLDELVSRALDAWSRFQKTVH